MLRHCSMPGMSSWSTRRSLHLMIIVPEDPDNLHTHTSTQNSRNNAPVPTSRLAPQALTPAVHKV